jgi:hypothetical protein
MPDFP